MKSIFTIIFCLGLSSGISAQTTPSISYSILSPLCNCNGSIEYTFSGFTSSFNVYYVVNGNYILHSMSGNGKDTLRGLCKSIIRVYAYNSGSQITRNDTFTDIFVTSLVKTDVICPATTGTINFSTIGGTPPITYECINATTGVVVGTSTSLTLPAGKYLINAIDGNGCKTRINSDSFSQDRDTIFLNNVSNCNIKTSSTNASCTNGTATVSLVSGTGAIPPYTYQWSNGATGITANNLIKGYYTVTATSSNGCPCIGAVYVNQTPNINVNFTPTPATCLQNDGSLIGFGSGGQTPYTYQWTNGQTSQSISNLLGNTSYGLTVTDVNGCIGTNSTFLSSTTPITATYSATPSSCTSSTGSATVSIVGGLAPYTVTWNTLPIQTGVTASNLPAGTYSFKITDANGCIRTGSAIIPTISSVNLAYSSTNPICPNSNGSILIQVSGSAPPFTYLWSNGSTTATINGLSAGSYSVTVTDINACKSTKFIQLSTTPGFTTGHNITSVSCIYNKDGAISITPYGGTAPFTYSIDGQAWGSSNTFSNLSYGSHNYSVKDANGCILTKNVQVNNANTTNSCYCTIEGYVYNDANSNCVKDAGEFGIANILMHLNGFGYTSTSSNGYYQFKVPTGTYTLSQQVQPLYPLKSCQSNSIAVNAVAANNCTQTINFADSLIPQHDLFINTFSASSAIVPGFTYTQKILTKNMGNIVEPTLKIDYKHDNQLTLTSVSSNLTNLTTQVVQSSSFPSLNPSSYAISTLNFLVPTNIPIGTQVLFKDTVAKSLPLSTEWLNDFTPWDNLNYYNKQVVSSFDPNSKEVTPSGKGVDGLIPDTTKELVYTINFQNLGTYFARNVVLVDTLSTNVRRETLTPIASSHKFNLFMDEFGTVKFIFNDIFLPEEATGGEASKGFVMYKIKLKSGLKSGDKIKNFADIYFDYNQPIRTNTAQNTILKSTSDTIVVKDTIKIKDTIRIIDTVKIRDTIKIKDTAINTNSIHTLNKNIQFTISPNPAVESFKIELNSSQAIKEAELTIYDFQGKAIYQWSGNLPPGQVTKTFDTRGLPDGLYFINFKSETHVLQEKLEVKH